MSDPFFYFFALSHNGETVGFATVWRLPGATYVEHFAIYPALRGKSFGSATVKALLDDKVRSSLGLVPSTPLVLEVELPESSPRQRGASLSMSAAASPPWKIFHIISLPTARGDRKCR